jgi:hypothetical protein
MHVAALCQILQKLLPGYKDDTGNIAQSTFPNFASSDAEQHYSLCKTRTIHITIIDALREHLFFLIKKRS